MKHLKKTPNAWDRFWDRVYSSEKLRTFWNRYGCRACEFVILGLVGIVGAAFCWLMITIAILAFPVFPA